METLTDYTLQLDNPPLLVVCDRERIVIHTAFTGYPDEPREIRIDELVDPDKRQILKWVFTDPEKLRPEKSTAAITAEAAGQFAQLAAALRKRGEDGQRVAHFLVQCLFCMFAEDEALLPAGLFTGLLANAGVDAGKAARRIDKLFNAMRDKGGEYGDHDIAWFNGGLFRTVDVPPLAASDLAARTAPPPTGTGARSTPPSSAPGANAASTPPPAPRSARTTPTPAPSRNSSAR
jgi:hypothetical protein